MASDGLIGKVTDLVHKVDDLISKINEGNISKINLERNYQLQLDDRFKGNPRWTEDYEKGLEPPSEKVKLTSGGNLVLYDCPTGHHDYPHLQHSFNPQLNTIVDLLVSNYQNLNKLNLQKPEGLETKLDILIEMQQRCCTEMKDLIGKISGGKSRDDRVKEALKGITPPLGPIGVEDRDRPQEWQVKDIDIYKQIIKKP